jgi:hypothetical protein
MGISSRSGGIGKNELSIKDIPARAQMALGRADRLITQSYVRCNKIFPGSLDEPL